MWVWCVLPNFIVFVYELLYVSIMQKPSYSRAYVKVYVGGWVCMCVPIWMGMSLSVWPMLGICLAVVDGLVCVFQWLWTLSCLFGWCWLALYVWLVSKWKGSAPLLQWQFPTLPSKCDGLLSTTAAGTWPFPCLIVEAFVGDPILHVSSLETH